ncbi:hydroxyproline dehydrogenase-like isoform X2 [Patiria miniata]|uniref:Proline dehydrogenase n=1 Tax=Patiria miniata TaxID=46514 RepID=A0A913ZY84_PATMI|nr:hydroxyproline dehydrogenase-like isoform X2 [Patiria miniata]
MPRTYCSRRKVTLDSFLQVKGFANSELRGVRVRSSSSTVSRTNDAGKAPARPLDHALPADIEAGARAKLDFSCPSTFRYKTAWELLRGLLVLKLSSYQKFVDNSLKIMGVSQRILGQRLFGVAARCTFYGHFIAGEGEAEARRLVERHEKLGVATILSVTAEEDVGETVGSYDEPRYDHNANGYMQCMDLSLALSRRFRPVSQLKVTSFAKADVLARVTELLQENSLPYDNNSPLSVGNLAKGLDGQMLSIPGLNEAENKHLRLVLKRLNEIGQRAIKNNAQLLVDAEKTNINPGITLLCLALMLKFNKEFPVIWNTYQCYLKQTMNEVRNDLQWSEQQGICFGVKIVRGAYMDAERAYAAEHGLEDPVHPSFEATSDMYNAVIAFMLNHIHRNPGRCGLIVATHNEESVLRAVIRMEELELSPTSGEVIFGQILGLSDRITVALGQAGYLIYKSSPYGPVDDVLPYLARRALENRAILQNTHRERSLMVQEIKTRFSLR